ncbi:MAG: SOS response-associated peptidase [Rhodospirillales bacterium]|nr:SOS response-associated peptidase [Rhodospirillales bacterium]
MCSNFDNDGNPSELDERFDLRCSSQIPNKQNIRPTDLALIIEAGRSTRLLPWGIPAPWAMDSRGKPIINARAETLEKKQTFRPLLEQRCLVPASTWYEWREAGGKKLKNKISLPESPLFAFAGLTDGNHFTLITCRPSPSIAHIHNRMPVVMAPNDETAWLDADLPFTAVAKLLIPYDAGPLSSEEDKPLQPDLFA